MSKNLTRRAFNRQLSTLAAAPLAASLLQPICADDSSSLGFVRGEPTADKVGLEVLAGGGNAIDAIVAAAMVAAVVVPHQTGWGGYGGHATIAVDGGKKITSIDFNTMAPAAMKEDIFAPDANGKVAGQKNFYGWLAAGVPGIPAGLEFLLKRYGTRSFKDSVQPAINLAKNGFPFGGAAVALKPASKRLSDDPASRDLYFKDGKPLEATDHYANPDLAKMLESLARDNSAESFYRGDIAKQIAAAFKANGGIVTAEDMAAYQAREVEPLKITWGDWSIHTAPLTAGGATILEAMLLLQELKWADKDPLAVETAQLQVEAFRYAWQDRLQFFGDPKRVDIEFDKLAYSATGNNPMRAGFFNPGFIHGVARLIERAVFTNNYPLPVRVTSRPDQGTINLSAVDKHGNLAALTLTHGGGFGANVTVPGLGLTLGHGMSRFDPHPGHPNCPGWFKRPLHNMCPTILCKSGQPMYALGARGGRKIPNAVAEVILQIVARGKSLTEAVAAPRLHTEGMLAVQFEKAWPSAQSDALKTRGYTVTTAPSATVSAAGLSSEPAKFVAAMR
ncbi:MAG TPA: gamma-glutamyltransferase [Pirellulaceae bacterium]|jgi:gamma-glutamyltranspeptidase/glutathione hydrolase